MVGIVADWSNNCVYTYEDQLMRRLVDAIVVSCILLKVPFDDEDHLYVTDNYRVQKLTIEVDYLLQIGWCICDEIMLPSFLIVHKVKYMFLTGLVITSLCFLLMEHSARLGQLDHPCDVSVNSNDKLLVFSAAYSHIQCEPGW